MTTIDQLENKVLNLETKIKGIQISLERIISELTSKASSTDLSREDSQIRELITDVSKTVSELDAKLAKVLLPEETRYYLEGSEVESFQSNFNKLKAMMIQFDKLYKNLVAYQAKQ
jgi:uncharacterized protein YukE